MSRLVLLTISLLIAAASDASAEGNVLKLAPTKTPGCSKLVTPNGHNWKALGHMGVSGTTCPDQFNGTPTMQARITGSNSVALGNGMNCVFDDTGKGTCK